LPFGAAEGSIPELHKLIARVHFRCCAATSRVSSNSQYISQSLVQPMQTAAMSCLLLVACIIALALNTCSAFSIQTSAITRSRIFVRSPVHMSDKEEQVPWTVGEGKKTARERAQFKNKVPFGEETYEVIRAAILLLSKRSAGEKLTVEETEWFRDAVEAIVEDANKFGPPPKPVKVDPETEE
jgi:hypothetical protein